MAASYTWDSLVPSLSDVIVFIQRSSSKFYSQFYCKHANKIESNSLQVINSLFSFYFKVQNNMILFCQHQFKVVNSIYIFLWLIFLPQTLIISFMDRNEFGLYHRPIKTDLPALYLFADTLKPVASINSEMNKKLFKSGIAQKYSQRCMFLCYFLPSGHGNYKLFKVTTKKLSFWFI